MLFSHMLSLTLKDATVLSCAIAHGRSQLKPENLEVGLYMEEVLEKSNYARASAHPGTAVH